MLQAPAHCYRLNLLGIGQLSGEELKFDDNNAAESIFLTISGATTKVSIGTGRLNHPLQVP